MDEEILSLKEGGQYQDALRLVQERVASSEQEFGPDHMQTAVWLNQLGMLCNLVGDYDGAEQAFLRSLEIKQKAKKPNAPAVAVSLLHVGDLYVTKGEYARAAPLLQQARDIREKALGPDHPDVAPVLAGQGRLKMFVGDYVEAEALNQRALEMSARAYGPDHWRVAACLDNLAEIRRHMGDLPTAEALLQRALAVREKSPRPDHPLLAREWNNLALIAVMQGKYAQAESRFTTALGVYARSVGTRHPAAAQAMSNLAGLYMTLGDYPRSEALQRQALEILESTYGPNHLRVALAVEKMGALRAAAGDYAASLQRYRDALDIIQKTVGAGHLEAANCLDGMGAARYALGDYPEAGDCYRRALRIREQALGETNIHVAPSLLNLARLSQTIGELGQAQTLALRALRIFESSYGPTHPRVAACFDSLATLRGALHDYPGAFEYGLKAQTVNQTVLDQVMEIPSEDLKLGYLAGREQSLHRFISLVAEHLAEQPAAVRSVFDMWLKRKGLVLESQKRFYEGLLDREDPGVLKTFHELERVRSRMSTLAFSPAERDNPETFRRQMEALERDKETLIQQLTRLSRAFALQRRFVAADAAAIAAALPARTALVEFARINTFNFGARSRRERWLPARYLAFVLHAGRAGDVRMLDLGNAAAIDAAVARLKTDLAAGHKGQENADASARRLHDLVFDPVARELGSIREVFIAPDGNLNLIPFEVLRQPGSRYLIEDYTFNYVAAGRDILAFRQIASRTGAALLMGDPDFDLAAAQREPALKASGGVDRRPDGQARQADTVRGLRFERLPGTRDEILAIRGLFGKSETESYLGAEALEEVLRTHGSPRILHLATHGFFLEDAERPDVTEVEETMGGRGIVEADAPDPEAGAPAAARVQNPLLRSGIALAGANSMAGDAPAGAGIVTAEKIIGLNLWGTEMVVLSACETGLGDVRTGEGVYGLRRAFSQAGAKSVVMSMWSVPDAETRELMTEFYRGIQSGSLNRCQALRQAVLKEMTVVRHRYGTPHPLYWGAFLFMGEP